MITRFRAHDTVAAAQVHVAGCAVGQWDAILEKTMTLEQMISDTLEVTDYLRNRFGKDKIYLMGHSGGTFIGIQAAARDWERDLRPLLAQYVDADVALRGIVPLQRLTIQE